MPKRCPQCGNKAARKSALHASDGVVRLLLYTPYRCRNCRFRFWQFNAVKPALLIGLPLLALFAGWWIPNHEPRIAEASPEGNYRQVAVRAARGDPEAELLMGLRYAEGSGVIKNEKEAVQWFEKAARHGKTEAQYRYGLALLEGRGVVQDYKAAFQWIEQPARQGHSYAQYSLGELYRYGTGTAVDKARAYLWFNLAAAQGLEIAAKARDSLAWQLKPEQIAAMQEEARHLSARHKAAVAPQTVATPTAPVVP